MEQTIKIEVPDGKKAIWNESTNTIEFVNKKPTRSKSWEEFCKNHPVLLSNEYYIRATGVDKTSCQYNSRREMDKGYLSNKEDAEGIYALIQLTRLHDEWVGDWKVDYSKKELVWGITYSTCGFTVGVWYSTYLLLSFPKEEMAREFLKCFKDLIETAKRFI